MGLFVEQNQIAILETLKHALSCCLLDKQQRDVAYDISNMSFFPNSQEICILHNEYFLPYP